MSFSPFLYFPLSSIYLISCPFLIIRLFYCKKFVGIFFCSGHNSFVQYMFCKYFLLCVTWCCLIVSLIKLLNELELLAVMKPVHCFLWLALYVLRSVCLTQVGKEILLVFFLRYISILSFALKFLI
jgi:hypothetical protein